MATSNFWRGDEKYIYVPKMFRGITEIDENKLEFLYNDFFNIELPTIIDEIVTKIENLSNEYYKKYDGEIEIIYHGEEYVNEYEKNLHYIEIIERSDKEGELVGSIYFGFIAGYYIAGNMIYRVERDKYFSKKTDKAIDIIINIIEKVYSKYCDKYGVVGTFSSGETIYEKYDNEEE